MSNELISPSEKPIGLCSDHAGFEMKAFLIKLFDEAGVRYEDFGTYSSESTDYPDYAHKLGAAIDNGDCERGIALCGTGNGINITMNKHQKVRAALCWNNDIVRLARQHNNANVLTLPARVISNDLAKEMVKVFFTTEFEGGRHQKRIDKIPLF